MAVIQVTPAKLEDLARVKRLADRFTKELGWSPRGAYLTSIEAGEILIAATKQELAGFVKFHIRRDQIVTIYSIVVDWDYQDQGVGKKLIEALREQIGGKEIRLVCPEGLPSNKFYEKVGFHKDGIKEGKKRRLVCWSLPRNADSCV